MGRTNNERKQLESLVSLSVDSLIERCSSDAVLGVISIPVSDPKKVIEELKSCLRKTDIVQESYGVIQVIALIDGKSYHDFAGMRIPTGLLRLREKVAGVFEREGIDPSKANVNYIRDPQNELKESDVLRRALGMSGSPYLGKKYLSKDEIEQQVGLIHALHPKLLESLEVLFAYSAEHRSRFDFVPRKGSYSMVPQATLEGSEDVRYRVGNGRFVVCLTRPGENAQYDAKRKKVTREYSS